MLERIFTDKAGQELIVKHRKSAVFFEGEVDVSKPNSNGEKHSEYICIKELRKLYNFTKEDFEEFIMYCEKIANESWSSFEPKVADSTGADYDDYYDKEFDNNGSLSIRAGIISIEAPYTQLKSNGDIVRYIKFNKRKFESFVFDLRRSVSK
ncbi:hypothetical protein ACQKNX_07950 [Lysinibacillus sp. NPDC093712]|uniref:hypothetical protein n=1 Tax=Lysinibacillus sp. NPDC093712 TaxID=3390579 RepID=UPI003D00B0FD